MHSMYLYTHLWSQSCLTCNRENTLLGLEEKYLPFLSATMHLFEVQ